MFMVYNLENIVKAKEETKTSHLKHQSEKTTFNILMYNFADICMCRYMKMLFLYRHLCVHTSENVGV